MSVANVPHIQAWTDSLNLHPTLPVDILGSIREEAINHILECHFKYDNDRYTLVFQKTFVANGKERTFKITIRADKPVRVDLPPYSSTTSDPKLAKLFNSGSWYELEPPPPSSKLTTPPLSGRAPSTPNVRVYCDSLTFTIEWPKLDGTGNWSWTPTPIAVAAEAVMELNLTQDGPILHLQVIKIKFDPASQATLRQQATERVEKLSPLESSALSDCDQKFDDLLVIAMNIAATTYAPKLVYDINIPVPVIAKTAVKPSLLELGDKIVTLGLTVDRTSISNRAAQSLSQKLSAFEALLNQDIEAAGGLDSLVAENPSSEVLLAKLSRSQSFLKDLENRVSKLCPKSYTNMAASVPDGLAVGASQYVLTRFAATAMPVPVNRCTDWAQVLDVVRGRICWWVHIFNPTISISGTTVSGQVSIDIGGEIDACVRKFWDCSWSWDCGALSLAVQGRPGIQLNLQSGSGITFYAQVQSGGLALEANLPWPFNKVVEALSRFVIDALIAVLNAVAANIKFDILLPQFSLPKQNTKLNFSDIVPFPYTRPGGSFSSAEKTFIGFSIGVTATK
jgi:hypothetical protein